jgi:ornithine carbamoyltransferase
MNGGDTEARPRRARALESVILNGVRAFLKFRSAGKTTGAAFHVVQSFAKYATVPVINPTITLAPARSLALGMAMHEGASRPA